MGSPSDRSSALGPRPDREGSPSIRACRQKPGLRTCGCHRVSAARLLRLMLAAVSVASALPISSAQLASARPFCYRVFPAESPFFVQLSVIRRQHLSCPSALKVGRSLYGAYHRGIPVKNCPPPPSGVPGGEGIPFQLPRRRDGSRAGWSLEAAISSSRGAAIATPWRESTITVTAARPNTIQRARSPERQWRPKRAEAHTTCVCVPHEPRVRPSRRQASAALFPVAVSEHLLRARLRPYRPKPSDGSVLRNDHSCTFGHYEPNGPPETLPWNRLSRKCARECFDATLRAHRQARTILVPIAYERNEVPRAVWTRVCYRARGDATHLIPLPPCRGAMTLALLL